jgi:hypothetical protein
MLAQLLWGLQGLRLYRELGRSCETSSMKQSAFEKLLVAHLVKKFPSFYGTKN